MLLLVTSELKLTVNNMQHMLRLVCLVCVIADVRSDLTVLPQNTVATSNSSAILQCSTNLGYTNINWNYNGNNTLVRSCVVVPALTAQFSTIHDAATGRCNLLVYNITQENAVNYNCYDTGFNNSSGSAYLIVLASTPIGHTNGTASIAGNDAVVMSCDASYHSGPSGVTATQTWSGDNCSSSTTTGNTSYVSSVINVIAQSPTLPSCSCTTQFNAPTNLPDGSHATNAPAQTSVWSSPSNILVSPANGGLTSPSDSAVMMPNSLALNCSTDTNTIMWSMSPFGQPNVVVTITDNSCVVLTYTSSQYTVNRTRPGQCDLIIPSTSPDVAGTFTCTRLTGSVLNTVSALVTILTSLTGSKNPNKSYLPQNQLITIQCSLEFTGPPSPYLRWSDPTLTTISETRQVIRVINNVQSNITRLTQPPPSIDGPHTCTVVFLETTKSPVYSWTSTMTQTSYCPRDVRITPNSGRIRVSEYVQCSSDAVPQASYSWTIIQLPDVVSDTPPQVKSKSGPNLTLTTGNYTVVCTAMNYLRGDSDPCTGPSTSAFITVSGAQIASSHRLVTVGIALFVWIVDCFYSTSMFNEVQTSSS